MRIRARAGGRLIYPLRQYTLPSPNAIRARMKDDYYFCEGK